MKRSDLSSLDDLRAPETVARLGSVRAAALELSLTHGAVSQRVAKLSGHLSCEHSLAVRWPIPRLSSFHDRHPGVEIQLSTGGGGVDFLRECVTLAIGPSILRSNRAGRFRT